MRDKVLRTEQERIITGLQPEAQTLRQAPALPAPFRFNASEVVQ